MTFHTGQEIVFKPKKGKKRKGIFKQFITQSKCMVLLEGDPFAVTVRRSQLRKAAKSEPSACGNNPKPVSSKKKVPKSGTNERKEETMTAVAEMPSAKELRKEAQNLGIEGWEDMSKGQMFKAIKKAKKSSNGTGPPKAKQKVSEESAPKKAKSKTSSKKKVVSQEVATKKSTKAKAVKKAAKTAPPKSKAPAKKASKSKKTTSKKVFTEKTVDKALGIKLNKGTAPKPLPAEGENPFRKKSNMFKVCKLLLKGGTRRKLAEKLAESTEIHPYLKGDGEIDLNDYDKRLLLGAEVMLSKFGYGVQRTGRGLDGKILVFRPGGPNDPRNKGKAKAKK